jgi:hypothetical protein
MLLEGTGGNSAQEVKEALRLPDDEKAVRQHFNTLLNSLQVNLLSQLRHRDTHN